jgi:hypothetical protein
MNPLQGMCGVEVPGVSGKKDVVLSRSLYPCLYNTVLSDNGKSNMAKKIVPVFITAFLLITAACSSDDSVSNSSSGAGSYAESSTESGTDTNQETLIETEAHSVNIEVGSNVLTATLARNSSVDALIAALSKGPITVNMRDYGSMEKVGSLGVDLPRNDEQITTEAGDIILYQGSALVIYYSPNSWNFTRLGKIDDVTEQELREILGDGNVTITLSLP